MTYTLELAKSQITRLLQNWLDADDLEIRPAPSNVPGDLAVPLFRLAKERKQNPNQIAQSLAAEIDLAGTLFDEAVAVGGYLNFTFNQEHFSRSVVSIFLEMDENYGSSNEGVSKTIVIDYSSPNIAKPFSVGHLRSTVIGQAINNIYTKLGYRVIGDNHIGDWGTQFGKLMCAFDLYGNRETVEADPINELLKLYVKFHDEAEKNPGLEEIGRKWFQRLEQGEQEAVDLWKWFADISWHAFERVYDLLGGIKFDEVLGESFYNDKLESTVKLAFEHKLACFSQADFDHFNSQFQEDHGKIHELIHDMPVKQVYLSLTKKSLKKLKGQNVPEDIVESLKAIVDRQFLGEDGLVAALPDDAKNYQEDILKAANRETKGEIAYWFDLSELPGDLNPTLLDELNKRARGLAVWGKALPKKHGEDVGEEVSESDEVALIHLTEFGIDTPLLIQKSDGTSLYATRDLATAKYRFETWQPDQILYVVGGEQQLYFHQWTTAFRLLGYETTCAHVWFGLVRLAEGRMSTRKGRVIFLEDVLDEAIKRAEDILEGREMSDTEKKEVARIVGVGAVKYSDLSQVRTKDVVFDWDKMLTLQGDSAPYLQYAYVRIQSIMTKAGHPIDHDQINASLLVNEKEISLLKAIAQFPETIRSAAKSYHPHLIANYVFSLSQEFNSFYSAIPVLKAENEALKHARLFLCHMTARVLKSGLALLGIECPTRM